MAYVSQDTKARIAAALKAIMPPGWKYSLAVRDRMAIVMTIQEAPADLMGAINAARNERAVRRGESLPPPLTSHVRFSVERPEIDFGADCPHLPLMEQIGAALKSADWYDKSDGMTDYADTAYYINVQIGRYDKPFVNTSAADTDANLQTLQDLGEDEQDEDEDLGQRPRMRG